MASINVRELPTAEQIRDALLSLPDSERALIKTIPPAGKYKITNLYVDPGMGKTVVEYDNIPQ